MIRQVLKTTEPRLRDKSKPVKKIDKKIKLLVRDLKNTLSAQSNPEGIGLAAPQIGKYLKVFIIKPAKDIKTIINPKIVEISAKKFSKKKKKEKIMEGCLSLPHFYGPLKRPPKIKIEYLDEDGNKKIDTFEGLEAQIIQHEIDHLEGVLFIDRLLEQKEKLYEYVDGEWEEVDLII